MDAVSQPELEQIERLDGADLVVAMLEPESAESPGAAVAKAREAIGGLSKIARAVVLSPNGAGGRAPATLEAAGEGEAPAIFLGSLPAGGDADTQPQKWSQAYRSVLALGGKLGARACAVIASR